MLGLVRDTELRGFLGPEPRKYKSYPSLRLISRKVKWIVVEDPDGRASQQKSCGIGARALASGLGSEAN